MLVGTDRFRPLAQQVAASLGAAWLPEVVVTHPIGGRTSTDLAVLADAAWEALTQLDEFGDGRGSPAPSAPSSMPGGAEQTTHVTGDRVADDHTPGVQAALGRLQEMIDEGYRLELVRDEDGTGHVLRVIAEDEACADCLVPDEILASILTAEVASTGEELGDVRVEHGVA